MMLHLNDLPLKDKRVLLRVDFNVPLDKEENIVDDTRIKASLPTINYILERGGKVILMSHLGRPTSLKESHLSLKKIGQRLEVLLGEKVIFSPDCIGPQVEALSREIKPSTVLLLENLRFYEAEEKPSKDPQFAKNLAMLGDLYVNDAFATAHRYHSSTAEIAKYFSGKKAPGFLMDKEIKQLSYLIQDPQRPFYALVGGSKISTKLGILKALLEKVDALFIGGGMAYTFMKAQHISIGHSIYEEDLVQAALDILELGHKKNIPIYLPIDFVVAKSPQDISSIKIVTRNEGIEEGYEGLDIGPKTIYQWQNFLKNAKTLFWNGPMGVFEVPAFAKGSNGLAEFFGASKALTVVGGGDSIAAIKALHLEDQIDHLSTGGGAALEFIEFGTLPGIEALRTL